MTYDVTATCPVCEAVIEIKAFDPDADPDIECPECETDLDWEWDEDAKTLELAADIDEEGEEDDLIADALDSDEEQEGG